jgi:hypothetical protein
MLEKLLNIEKKFTKNSFKLKLKTIREIFGLALDIIGKPLRRE